MATLARKKLLKLMGKSVEYTAKIQRICEDGVLLTNVKYKNKVMTDHVWVGKTLNLSGISLGKIVVFMATAITYTDSRGNRKHGLNQCFNFIEDTEARKILSHDKKHYKKRLR